MKIIILTFFYLLFTNSSIFSPKNNFVKIQQNFNVSPSSHSQSNSNHNDSSYHNNKNCYDPQLIFHSPPGPEYQTNYSSVQTPLGIVRIVTMAKPRPRGWRIMRFQERQQVKAQLTTLLDFWSIVAFDCNGKLDGYGYGNKLSPTRGVECGNVFIIKGD